MTVINPLNLNAAGLSPKAELKRLARETVQNEARREGRPIPGSSKAFKKLDQFLNLGSSRDLSLDDLDDAEKEEFFKMLSTLLKNQIVGYHVYDVDGKPEKHYVVNEIGDKRLYGRKLYKERQEEKIWQPDEYRKKA